MRPLDAVFAALAVSPFRQRFRLRAKERDYLVRRTKDQIAADALRFVAERLAPANPKNDGKQTPMRGHPVFVAQHATATCCRGCLAKWHAIPPGRPLTRAEQQHAVTAILRWIGAQPEAADNPAAPAESDQLQLAL